jgi:hypothetical protein
MKQEFLLLQQSIDPCHRPMAHDGGAQQVGIRLQEIHIACGESLVDHAIDLQRSVFHVVGLDQDVEGV